MPVFLTFYGGAGCIGGNKILLEDGENALFFDFGTNFGAEGKFFDEFLAPRASFGLYDLLCLDILPPLKGIYRKDMEYPGIWEKFSSHGYFRHLTLRGVILSHAHYDHCGHFSYISEDIPVITRLSSALICKALQDTGGGNRLQEICYINPRELRDGLLQTGNYRSKPYRQRRYVIADKEYIPEKACGFWENLESSRSLQCCSLGRIKDTNDLGDLRVISWPVDHSVPGASAYAIETSEGWVVYTGDLRLHGKNGGLTREFFNEAAKLNPVALICEGTHPGTVNPVTEEQVAQNCFDAVKKAKGIVVADFGPRNVERLLSFLSIAKETKRKLVLTSKDIYLLEALNCADEPEIPNPLAQDLILLYNRPKTRKDKWEEALYDRFDFSKIVDAEDIKQNPKDYILCFSYYDFHAFLDIEPKGGTYIYSSSEAYDEEMLIDHNRIKNWIEYFGFELYGSLGRDREKSGFHASGHIHGPGIEEMVETIKPRVLIPIHTQDKEFFKRFEGKCQVILPERNKTIEL